MKIDGKIIAAKILSDLKIKVKKLNLIPHLAIIIVGHDPASKSYVEQKKLFAEKIGVKTSLYQYPDSISAKDLLSYLNDLNHLSSVHGIIVQRPLPQNIDGNSISLAIDPAKDVDGFNPKSKFRVPIGLAVLRILKDIFPRSILCKGYSFTKCLKEKKIVVVGKGETGGKPIIDMLKKMGVKPFILDSKTTNKQDITKTADIIISAVGKKVLEKEMIKKGVILIGVGIHKQSDGKFYGDYSSKKIKDIASFYTPTPGGVGPVNVSMLMENLIKSAENS